ncbi:MAG: Pycsar system effector family protein [Chitinophagales bacterium]
MENENQNSKFQQAENDNAGANASKVTAKKFKLEKGAEALLRLNLRNHMDLSDMADRKASLLITINTLVISIVASLLYTKLSENEELILPTLILLGTSLVTTILAVISTRPKVSKGKFTTRQVKNKAVNLLFFGNFHKMSLKEFLWASDEMFHDREYMFDALTSDIHSLGVVVARKYRFLHYAYNVFMYGLIVSVIAFVVSFFLAYDMV